nr:hypothetical protein BaRGS_027408 [Batillaria attramentaria]
MSDMNKGEFGDKRDLVTLLSVFHGRRQGKTEGVYQYAHAVLAAAARVNAKLKDHLSEDLVRDRFADGLHPPELRRDVRRLVTLSVTVQPSENTASAGNVGDDDADRMAGHTRHRGTVFLYDSAGRITEDLVEGAELLFAT